MKYRKKPVIIDAVEWTGANHLITETFMKDSGATIDYSEKQLGVIKIPTLEGMMSAQVGDFIIKGVNGEFYPCKPDIFAKTYENGETKFLEETFTDRLLKETKELRERLEKLQKFLSNKERAIEISGQFQYDLLIEQSEYMDKYLKILHTRINDLISAEE